MNLYFFNPDNVNNGIERPPPMRIPVLKLHTLIRIPVRIYLYDKRKNLTQLDIHIRIIEKYRYYTKIGPVILTKYRFMTDDPRFPESRRYVHSLRLERPDETPRPLTAQDFPIFKTIYKHDFNSWINKYRYPM